MKHKLQLKILAFICLTFLMACGPSIEEKKKKTAVKDIISRHNPTKLVNDYVGVLTLEQNADLEKKLLAYKNSTSTEVAVVIEPSCEDNDIDDYCQRLAENWGIGQKGKNKGILIYLAFNDRKMRINTGYGIEANIKEALIRIIMEDYFKPNFKDGKYYEGLDQGTDIIFKAAQGEYLNDIEISKIKETRQVEKPTNIEEGIQNPVEKKCNRCNGMGSVSTYSSVTCKFSHFNYGDCFGGHKSGYNCVPVGSKTCPCCNGTGE
jgi:uncharacterized membrane protein YgcG